MHLSEPCAAADRRFIWISVFAVALWLSLVNVGPAFAGGEHPPQDEGYSHDQGSGDWQHDKEGTPGSWGGTPDEGHPPPEAPVPEEPCKEEQPPEETPPPSHETPPGHETPPVEKPPVEKPPVEKPPVETPPVVTPPVVTPPVVTPPVVTPPVVTPPVVTPPETPDTPESPPAPVEEKGGGGVDVLPQEQGSGGEEAPTGGITETSAEAGPAATLPFTGSRTPLLVLLGTGFLVLGVGVRRLTSERV
jgi:hypothetical protein